MKCKWKYNDDKEFTENMCSFREETYKTSCGETYYSHKDDVNREDFKFCPFCGKEIEEVAG